MAGNFGNYQFYTSPLGISNGATNSGSAGTGGAGGIYPPVGAPVAAQAGGVGGKGGFTYYLAPLTFGQPGAAVGNYGAPGNANPGQASQPGTTNAGVAGNIGAPGTAQPGTAGQPSSPSSASSVYVIPGETYPVSVAPGGSITISWNNQ